MSNNGHYITEEKFELLKEELEELKTSKRKEILEALDFAKSLGDLSENAEYHQAREDQGKLEERISKIEQILKDSTIVKKHHSTKVEIGSTIYVQKEGVSEKQKYQIVGSEEADMLLGKISNQSPLGEALFGKKKGDSVSYSTQKGTFHYTIVDIE